MASSIIKQQLSVETSVVTWDSNPSFSSSGAVYSRKFGNVVQVRFDFGATAGSWSAGTQALVGNFYGKVPSMQTYIPLMLTDGGHAVGWLIIPNTSGSSLRVNPLTTIPSGVTLKADGTYICN